MQSFTDFVKLRPELTMPGSVLHGIVSLSDVTNTREGAIEGSAEAFLDLTYPSEALIRLLSRLNTTLYDQSGDCKGLFVVRGGYGSGKSHILVALYHLLYPAQPTFNWLEKYHEFVNFTPPNNVVPILMPMMNLKLRNGLGASYLWEPIFEALEYDGFRRGPDSYFPTEHHISEALDGRTVVLIIDEFERWLLPIADKAQKDANLTFLQNMTSYAQDGSRGLIVFLTLLGIEPTVDSLVNRADRWDDDLTGARDRDQMVLHRLIQSKDWNYAEAVTNEYLSTYQSAGELFGDIDLTGYRESMLGAYPFHPEVIKTIFERHSSVANANDKSYQNSRGALRLLGHLLEVGSKGNDGELGERDLLLTGDLAIDIDAISRHLNNLNPKLIQVARQDLDEARNFGVNLAQPILSSSLLYSLGDTNEERLLGAQMADLLFACLRPGDEGVTPTDVETALGKLALPAVHLHQEANPERWRFKESVNLDAQVIRRANRISDEEAVYEITRTLHELAPGSYFHPHESPRDQAELAIVLLDQKLDDPDLQEQLYYGRQFPNSLVIVEPRDRGQLTSNQDVLMQARMVLSAQKLQSESTADTIQLLKSIEERHQSQLRRRLQDAFGMWMSPAAAGGDIRFVGRRVDLLDRDEILRVVSERYGPNDFRERTMQLVENHDAPNLLTVGEIIEAFYRQRAFPKPIWYGKPSDEGIETAIRALVHESKLTLLRDGDAKLICGEDPGFLQPNWQARIARREDMPVADIEDYILSEVNQGEVTLKEVRDYIADDVAKRDLRPVASSDIYETVQALAIANRIEIVEWDQKTPVREMPEGAIIRRPQKETPVPKFGWENIPIGPVTIHQLLTRVTTTLTKTDAIRNVEITVEHVASGASIGGYYGNLLGSQEWQDGRLNMRWTLSDIEVTNRDALHGVLQMLCIPDDAYVTLSLQRQTVGK